MILRSTTLQHLTTAFQARATQITTTFQKDNKEGETLDLITYITLLIEKLTELQENLAKLF